ncbi:MAG: TetR/AcrR family transcriptional regulator [Acidobacteriota bacterium]
MPSFPKPPTLNDDERAIDIYREAAHIIRDKGFDATSMGDIAKAVDLTKGGLYYYIKGKEALLYAIMCFALEELDRRVLAPAQKISEPSQRLAHMLSAHLKLVLDETNAMVVLADELEGLSPEHRRTIEERYMQYRDALRDTAASMLAESGHRTLDPSVAAGALCSLAEGVVRWFDAERHPQRDHVVEQVTRMALQSLDPGAGASNQAVA